jgi:osmoprotectant transport system ATP-binding protein
MVEFLNLTKIYEKQVVAVNSFNLKIEKGELIVFIGPSGCGKTTTLKMINRLIEPTSGQIVINGQDTKKINPVELRRRIGYVIQDIALFPHWTVARNISTVLVLEKWSKDRMDKRVDELLELVGMDPAFYRTRYPNELSGGQQQRIGVLRALASEPEVLLMDEPFGALDPITREQLQEELKRLQKKVNKTIVFVTHDMNEAIKIADRIVMMREGSIVQVGTPEDFLRNPVNDFVRSFIGEERLIRHPDSVFIHEVMLRNPVCIESHKGLYQGLETMREERVDCLLVTDHEGEYLGVVDVSTIQRNVKNNMLIKEIIVGWPTVRESDYVLIAVKLMVEHNLRFVPVIDDHRNIVGIVTRSNVVNFIMDYL